MGAWERINKVLTAIITITYIAMIIVVSIQVVCRVIPVLKAPSWTEELSRYLTVYIVAFSIGYAIKGNAFISVDTLKNHLGERKRAILDLAITAILVVFFGVFFVSAVQFFKLGMPQHSITMPIFPMSLIYFSLLILTVQIIGVLVLKVIKTVGLMKCKEAK